MLCKTVVAHWFTMNQRLDHKLPHSSVSSLVWTLHKCPARAHLLVCVCTNWGKSDNLEKLMDSLEPLCCSLGCAFAGCGLFHHA